MNLIPTFYERELKAPVSFAFAWLTDYSPDDSKINPSLNSRKVLERRDNDVKIEDIAMGPPLNKRVATIHLSPPDSWDVKADCTVYDYDLHYRLAPTAKGCKLTIVGAILTKPGCPFKTRAENDARFVKSWDNYGAALEADYKKTQRK